MPQTVENFKVVGKLHDRSILSTEMTDLCANLPIYRVAKGRLNQSDTEETSDDEVHDTAEMPGEGEGNNKLHRQIKSFHFLEA